MMLIIYIDSSCLEQNAVIDQPSHHPRDVGRKKAQCKVLLGALLPVWFELSMLIAK